MSPEVLHRPWSRRLAKYQSYMYMHKSEHGTKINVYIHVHDFAKYLHVNRLVPNLSLQAPLSSSVLHVEYNIEKLGGAWGQGYLVSNIKVGRSLGTTLPCLQHYNTEKLGGALGRRYLVSNITTLKSWEEPWDEATLSPIFSML